MKPFPLATLSALRGQAVGDAFGAPFEFSPQAHLHAANSLRSQRYLDAVNDVGSRLRFSRIPGLYTDDTQQALVLLRAWLDEDDPGDAAAVASRFQSIITDMFDHWVTGSQAGVHRGTDRNFRDAIMFGGPTNSPGVGAAMRIGPVSTLFHSMEELLPWVFTVSRVTTTHPLALAAAGVYAAHCHGISCGKSPEAILAALHAWQPPADLTRAWRLNLEALSILGTRSEEELLTFAQATGAADKTLGCAASGFALTTVPWAIHQGQNRTFNEVLMSACKSGGDTDTVCAMAGCLSAIRLGANAIPLWMIQGLKGFNSIDNPATWHPINSEQPLTEEEHRDRHQREQPTSAPEPPSALPSVWEKAISVAGPQQPKTQSEPDKQARPAVPTKAKQTAGSTTPPQKGQLGLFD